jgi:transcriptional regulator with XRE-family HTH domain
MALLLREALGESLRRARVAQSRTLREVSTSARVSLGYLSEVERGRKEASSELLAAICDALDVPLADVLTEASQSLAHAAVPAQPAVPASAPAAAPASAALSTGSAGIVDREIRIVIPAPRPLAAAY